MCYRYVFKYSCLTIKVYLLYFSRVRDVSFVKHNSHVFVVNGADSLSCGGSEMLEVCPSHSGCSARNSTIETVLAHRSHWTQEDEQIAKAGYQLLLIHKEKMCALGRLQHIVWARMVYLSVWFSREMLVLDPI